MDMNIYEIGGIIITLAVAIAYLNHRFLHLQTTTAIMAGSLLISLLLIIIGQFGFSHTEKQIAQFLATINFHDFLMNGILSFLLFAGALTVDINDLKKRRWEIGILATLGTLASAFLVAGAVYGISVAISHTVPFIYCLLFGSLISPTDPIAVLAMFKEVDAPRFLHATVAGESLFNDGVGIVLFLTVYQVAFSGSSTSFHEISLLFVRQALGGIVYGILLGLFAYWLIKPIDEHKIEIMITLAIATGGYAVAEILNISGPLAMVVSGIFIGNRGRNFRMSKQTRDNLDTFWELVDEILNALLFVLIGLELLSIPMSPALLLAAGIAIPLVLVMRFITVSIPMSLFKLRRKYVPHSINIMVWGGLRGGLAVALALAIPEGPYRSVILAMTYAVVAFAIIVQGLTIRPLLLASKRRLAEDEELARTCE